MRRRIDLARQNGAVICIRCRTTWSEGTTCPSCGPNRTEHDGRPERGGAREWCELSPVFEAPHEIAAISVRTVLEEDGIPAVVRSAFVPAYGGVAMTLAGCWGWVLVPKEEVDRARPTVEAYLVSLGVHPSGEKRPPRL